MLGWTGKNLLKAQLEESDRPVPDGGRHPVSRWCKTCPDQKGL